MLHSLWRLTQVDPGFRTEQILTARVALNGNACGEGDAQERCRNFFSSLLERSRGVGGVSEAALVSSLPMRGFDEGYPYDVEGHPRAARQSPDQGSSRAVSPGYFALMDIQLMQGRLIGDADASGASHAVVINRAMAAHYWPGASAIGKRIEWLGQEKLQGTLDAAAFRVVGVVSDTRHESLDQGAGYEMYTAMTPLVTTTEMSLLVRYEGAADDVAREIRGVVHAIDATAPVYEVETMGEVLQDSAKAQRSLTALLIAFAVLALGVGMTGVYSLMAFMVGARTREMGIRLALGATRAQLARLVVGQGLVLAGTGCAVGVMVAALVSHWLRSFLFATSPLDPAAFLGVPLLLAALAMAASWIPARRAARTEPMSALRTE